MLLSTYKVGSVDKMNRSNKLLLIVLSFVVVCVVGYALFSETITVTGTATAKGSFDIELTCTKGVPSNMKKALDAALNQMIGTMFPGYPTIEGGYSDNECIVNGNTITYSVNLNYPGALRYFIVKAKNIGTISAKLNINDAEEYLNGGKSIKNETCIYNKSDNSLSECNSYSYISNTLGGFNSIIANESATGELYTFENDKLWDHLDADGYYFADPNESLYFVYGVAWNKGWTDNTKYLTYEGIFELPFVQYVN